MKSLDDCGELEELLMLSFLAVSPAGIACDEVQQKLWISPRRSLHCLSASKPCERVALKLK
jgi:hypothetical protein